MKVVAIVQARMGSTRLQNKVMKPIMGKPMIELLLHRLVQSKELDQIIVATSTNIKNNVLDEHVKSLGFPVFRGNEEDVLERFVDAAKITGADIIVRITGDCPLMDPVLVDSLIKEFKTRRVDYLSNTEPATYPDGLDVEVFSRQALERCDVLTDVLFDREHVTPYLRSSDAFEKHSVTCFRDLSSLRWTVDEPADFEVISAVFEHFAPNKDFSWIDVLNLFEQKPQIFIKNSDFMRNEGAFMNSGQKLWRRAKQIIPGGNMLLSKRAEMFAPGQWPAYFSKAKGCNVWDLDGNKFVDMSLMGIGTNTLGYGHEEVDSAVQKCVQKGNMTTLNAPEEVYLAEQLVEIHPWADMVRFARSGGEANAISVRIARAAAGRDKVAICGYHGWHDWYLSANLGEDESLSSHLLPGLEPNGVPKSLRGSVVTFNYNDFQALEDIVSKGEIAAIKMEVVRNKGPENNFLHRVRKLADDNNIILIFDECTSGFRETFGGLHKKYNVEPDLAIFGKTLGNGYAANAIIGRREIMEAAQTTFISSTFWTERIGSVAALKTLEVMQREKSWEYITNMGAKVRVGWQELADLHGLDIEHWGLPALAGFTFKSENAQSYKTFITQEMLERGYLAGTSVYSSLAHTAEHHAAYFEALSPIFKTIKNCEDGLDIKGLLKGPTCHSDFKRLN